MIPIRHLTSGITIDKVPVAQVTCYRLEPPRYDVVVAQGLPAESFLDLKDGSTYANRPDPVRVCPDCTAHVWEASRCTRLLIAGSELAPARAMVERCATNEAVA